jgi:hypothetical protein
MTLEKAIANVERWTTDMPREMVLDNRPLFDTLRTLLDHSKQQRQDIAELTHACRVLFRRNKELQNELLRSKATSD